MHKLLTGAGVGLLLTGPAVLAAPAGAEVDATRSATKVAKAMTSHSGTVISAKWMHLPPKGAPAATSTTKLVGFPRAGASYAILSTGDATAITKANDVGDLSTDLAGPPVRGTRDTTTLRVRLRVPRGGRCLSFSFRFLSEEYPEYVDSAYNDAFVAELGKSTWTGLGGERVKAPRNFAFGREKTPITVNRTGDFNVTAERARGTTYDAATRRLRASRPVKPGKVDVFFSIFDQADRQYDSSVLIDRLSVNRRTPCVSGASLD